MKNIKRLLLLMLVLALSLAIVACGGDKTCTEHKDADGDGKCDECGAAVETSGGGGDGTLELVKNGEVKVQVVVDPIEYILIRKEFVKLADTLSEFGATLNVVKPTDADAEADLEILIGDGTCRDEKYVFDGHKLGPEGSALKIVDSKIIIVAGSQDALTKAAKDFIAKHFKITDDMTTLPDITLTAEDCYEKPHDPDDYRWSDVTINGNDADDYVIVADTKTRIDGVYIYLNAAEYLRDNFYLNSGKWMDIVDVADLDTVPAKAIVIAYDEAVKADGGFKSVLEGDQIKLLTYYPKQIEESASHFMSKMLLKKGELEINKTLAATSQELRYVYYEDFGAKGDGKTDDFVAMAATHEYANQFDYIVKAKPGATYYIKETGSTETNSKYITIKTDVVWTGCTIVIDDRSYTYLDVGERTANIFRILPDERGNTYREGNPIFDAIVAGGGFKTTTTKINYQPGRDVMLFPYDEDRKVYIRYGGNANEGNDQHELIIVHADGTLDANTPVMLDYNQVTKIVEYYIDDKPITISGGTLITRANASRCQYDYFSRNINIGRSNVTFSGVEHKITDEGDTGAPYSGFFSPSNCNNIRFENCIFQSHRMYEEERSIDPDTGKIIWGTSMGTYDLGGSNANNIYYYNCRQSNFYAPDGTYTNKFYDENGEIPNNNKGNPASLWGCMGTNYCKNITYDNCEINRFDAHCGVYNATIKDTTTAMINLIGAGTALIENSTVYNTVLVSLRSDYGSTWDGEIIFKDVKWRTGSSSPNMITGSYTNHYFGYETHLPSVTVDNLTIVGSNATSVNIFGDFGVPYESDPSLPNMGAVPNKNIMHYPSENGYIIKNNGSGYTFRVAPSGCFFSRLPIIQE